MSFGSYLMIACLQHTLAKGRTNIELREQFILADGVSQTMTAFRSKPSPTSTLQRSQLSSTGPITKVTFLSSLPLLVSCSTQLFCHFFMSVSRFAYLSVVAEKPH